MSPLFSVIIPTLNEEKYLPRLLADLHNQKMKNFEVVIVDGKSDDQTKVKAAQFGTVLPLIFLESKMRNVSFQRNLGAVKSRGEFLIFIDADCRINPTFTKRLQAFIEKQKGLLFLPYVDPEDSTPETKAFYQLVNFVIQASQSFGKPLSSVGSIIIQKNLFMQIGGFEEELYISEDHNLIQKAKIWGVRAKPLNNIKIKFSFRRIRREGRFQSMYKLLVGTVYTLFKGDVKEKIFNYEMGGHLYRKKLTRKDKDVYLKQIKDFFSRY
ncbi:MAG: glycosyltransferase [Patescibacteria group bacterium]